MMAREMPSWEDWHALSAAMIAQWLTAPASGTAIGLDATQRWFTFIYQPGQVGPAPPDYVTAGAGAAAALLTLLIDHGLDPLFVPIQVPLARGPRYVQGMLEVGVPALLAHPQMQHLATRVRIRTYGPWPTQPPAYGPAAPALARLAHQFAALAGRAPAGAPRLFWMLQLNAPPSAPPADPPADGGVADPLAALLQVAWQLQAGRGRPPTRPELLTHFYHLDPGESLPPLRLVLSSELGDLLGQVVPPLLGGQEDYYFPAVPLLNLDQATLRAILYDWLFGRQAARAITDYASLPATGRARLVAWYARHQQAVLGLGDPAPDLPLWVPGVPAPRLRPDELP